MYGFFVTNAKSNQGKDVLGEAKTLKYKDIQFVYNPMPKFEQDKLFYEDSDKIVLLDGVIFNKRELMERTSGTWQDVFEGLYRDDPQTFFNGLRGSFCGAVLEKNSLRLTAFTNHSGEKTVYYTVQNGIFIVASHNNILTEILRENNLPVRPDLTACQELVALGSILHGKTPFQKVRRVTAGKYVKLINGQSEEFRYHMFHNVPEHDLTLEECIEELDKRFRKAVDRIFSKNKEYGYMGECDLSGGLDSRMVTWVAHDLGFQNIANVCYCQSGNIDHTTSRRIARDLGNEYVFLPMNGGDFLTEVDEVVDKFGGQVSYLICTGANRAMKELRNKNIFLCATGLLGELHNAYWVEGEKHTAPAYTALRYSSVIDYTVPAEYSVGYENYEQMNLYEFSALLFLSSSLVRQQQAEVTSPFIDVDYLEFAYRIPLRWRQNYGLTKAWMVSKYPKAASYVWQTKRMPVSYAYYNKIYWPKVAGDVRRFFVRCINKVGRTLHVPIQISQRTDMNPFDLWYRTNPSLREFVTDYYEKNISRVQDPVLLHILMETFSKGAARDKLQVINLLAVYKRYF